jgi:hypothetical protein
MKHVTELKDFPSNWELLFISLVLLIFGDVLQAFMSSIGVADFLRYIVIGFVALMVITSLGVILARLFNWLKFNLNQARN